MVSTPGARADRAADLVRIHTEAIGGTERIAALHALRASGEVVAGGKRMRFTLIAARPNRVREETEGGGRTLIQGSDGVNPPWEFDTGRWPPRYTDMKPEVAKTFAADAEFDDPLVGGKERGFTIEYGGEVAEEGRKLIRLTVTRRLIETFSLLLDPETYFILYRVEDRNSPIGGKAQVVTRFSDYRPVAGVLVPHTISLLTDGRVVQQTRIDSIEANPEIGDEVFRRPAAGSERR